MRTSFYHAADNCTLSVVVNSYDAAEHRIMVLRARSLRRNLTGAEKLLWSALRNRRLTGIRFRRQVVIGRYVADFCAANPKIVIELDGVQHEDQRSYDEARTRFLEEEGYLVLRFWNVDVLGHLAGVLETLATEAKGCGWVGEE
jgi:very-short-patch-repair endonuclease